MKEYRKITKETKRCSKCQITKSWTEFSRANRYSDGLEYYCKSCKTDYARAWAHGRSVDEIQHVKYALCEICGENHPRMALDHNHETGQYRGILCYSCNIALGMVKEDRNRLQNLIAYLDKYEPQAVAEEGFDMIESGLEKPA